MNKKAESFKAFLNKSKIDVFAVEEAKDDASNAVVFRSHLDISGNQLPTIVVLDDSIYAMVRVLVTPKVEEDKADKVRALLNKANAQYKVFKYYLDENNSIILDLCLVTPGDKIEGELVYAMFEVIINHLNEFYKELMEAIWSKK